MKVSRGSRSYLMCSVLMPVLILSLGAAAAAEVLPAPAPAPAPTADAAEQGPATIIVTARKREERLQDVPVALSVVSGAALNKYASGDLRDASKLVPNLIIASTGSQNGAAISLRGVGSSPTSVGFDQSVSINIDGVQISRGLVVTQGQFDLARMEVLRGPQALFYGKNSTGGIVSLTSEDPTRDLELIAKIGYEAEAEQWVGTAIASGQLAEGFGARLAYRHSGTHGYFKNIATARPGADPLGFDIPGPRVGSAPRSKEDLVKLTLAYDAGGGFDANLKVAYSSYFDKAGPQAGNQIVFCPLGVPQTILSVPDAVGARNCKADGTYAVADPVRELAIPMPYSRGTGEPYSDMESIFSRLLMNYESDNLKLTSLTGFYKSKQAQIAAYFNTGGQLIASESNDFRSVSQELRLVSQFDGPLNFLVGALYEDTAFTFSNNARPIILPVDPATGRYHAWNSPSSTDGTSYSAFGQVIWNLSSVLELSGGARWTHEKKISSKENTWTHPLVRAVFPILRVDDTFKDSNFSPEATLTWRPTTDLTIYGAYREGYKSGGFNNNATLTAATTIDDLAFGSETASGFELGLRSTLLDRALQLNITAYDYKYSNLQVNQWNALNLSYSLANAGQLVTKGVEIETIITPRSLPGFNLHGSIAYNDAKYDDYVGQCWGGQTIAQGCNLDLAGGAYASQSYAGKRPPRAPTWVAAGGFDYTITPADGWKLNLSADARYSGKYKYLDTLNPYGVQKEFVLLDAGVRFGPDNERWQIAFIGRNLTNKYIVYSGVEVPYTGVGTGTATATPADLAGSVGRPRQLWVELSTKF